MSAGLFEVVWGIFTFWYTVSPHYIILNLLLTTRIISFSSYIVILGCRNSHDSLIYSNLDLPSEKIIRWRSKAYYWKERSICIRLTCCRTILVNQFCFQTPHLPSIRHIWFLSYTLHLVFLSQKKLFWVSFWYYSSKKLLILTHNRSIVFQTFTPTTEALCFIQTAY